MGFFDLLFGQKQPQTIHMPSIMSSSDINTIQMGQFPSITTNDIYLQKGEICYYADNARLMNEKVVKDYIRRYAGTSFNGIIFDWMRYGQGYSKKIQVGQHTETEYFDGKLFVTSKRTIFLQKEAGFDKKHTTITAINAYDNGIEIQYGSRTYTVFVPDGYLLNDLFELLH